MAVSSPGDNPDTPGPDDQSRSSPSPPITGTQRCSS